MAAITNGDHDSSATSNTSDYVKELQKNIRNITKKLSAMHKTDSVIAENPGVSLDDLVAQRKINADQKASALKKPQLQQQLSQLEDQIEQYKKVDAHYQTSLSKQKDELTQSHAAELEKVRESARAEAQQAADSQLRGKLLTFSQFLRAAAAKRSEEDAVESEENQAFEGVLLLVYGGDSKAVDAAIKVIDGSDEKAPSIDGDATNITYAQVKQAAIEHSPFQLEEAWVDSVAEANANGVQGSDPTLANAGLTEVQNGQVNGLTHETSVSQPLSTDASNAAADRWDSNPASGGAESAALEESYEVIPRPGEEVDIPASQPDAKNVAGVIEPTVDPNTPSWADEPVAHDRLAAGAESYGRQAETDGFQEVAGRSRGRGGRGGFHRGNGEHRGRGHHRGRGSRGDFRGDFRGGRGEYRGRGRGHRGDGPPRG